MCVCVLARAKGSGKEDKVYIGGRVVGGEKRLRLVHEYSSKLINRRNPRVGSEHALATLRDVVRMKYKTPL